MGSDIKNGTIRNADIAAGAAISASKINRTGLNADLLDGNHASAFSAATHDHNSLYSVLSHNHDVSYYTKTAADAAFATVLHNHNTAYADLGHSHDSSYSVLGHDHDTDYYTKSQSDTRYINDGAFEVDGNDIVPNAVNSSKIQNGAIYTAHLISQSVNSDKIKNDSITNADIKSNAGIADSKISYSTKTGYLSISHTALTPEYAGYNFSYYPTLRLESGSSAYFKAPVYLPQGAVVKKLYFYHLDNTSGYVFANLFRQPHIGSVYSMAYSGNSADSASWKSLIDSSIGNPNIDNGSYAYWVEVRIGAASTNLRVGNTVIEYTYTSPGS